jgi:hypothetical protein
MTETEFEMAALRAENDRLLAENDELRSEIEELRREADLDSCHAAGLAAQIRAVIREGESCPNAAAHPLLERAEYTNALTGEPMTKTRAYPLYRQAFDDMARELGIDDAQDLRA